MSVKVLEILRQL